MIDLIILDDCYPDPGSLIEVVSGLRVFAEDIRVSNENVTVLSPEDSCWHVFVPESD